jgi:hypothetical protein
MMIDAGCGFDRLVKISYCTTNRCACLCFFVLAKKHKVLCACLCFFVLAQKSTNLAMSLHRGSLVGTYGLTSTITNVRINSGSCSQHHTSKKLPLNYDTTTPPCHHMKFPCLANFTIKFNTCAYLRECDGWMIKHVKVKTSSPT